MFRKQRTKIACVLATLLLVLSLATVAVSWPLPTMLARTQVAPTIMTPINGLDGMESKVVHFEDFAVTTDADTTSTMYIGGLIPWRIINESGGAATLTFYDSRALDGNELTLYDQDDVAVAALTIGDDESMELPSAMAGCTWLVIKGGGAASGFTLVCRR